MKIGIDISALSEKLNGVARATACRVESLLRENTRDEYLLFSPFSGSRSLNGAAGSFQSPRVQISYWKGPCALLARLLGHLPLSLRKQGWCPEAVVFSRSLRAQLGHLDVFHFDSFFWDHRPGQGILTVHDITPLLFPQFHNRYTLFWHERKLRFMQQMRPRVLADSKNTRDDLVKHCGIPSDRIQVVYNGCNHAQYRVLPTDRVARILQRYHLKPGYILHVGTLEPRKNIERLIGAFEILVQKMGRSKEQLVLVGSKGWLCEKIYRRLENSPRKGQIVWCGYVPEEDLPYLYNGAAFLVYPSLYEGFGLPVIEAMACGVPVITSGVSSLPEVAGGAGVLVDPYDTQALAAAMHRLLIDPDQRAKLAVKGIRRAGDFSWEKMARQILSLYEEAAS